jgi:hypothetical protein
MNPGGSSGSIPRSGLLPCWLRGKPHRIADSALLCTVGLLESCWSRWHIHLGGPFAARCDGQLLWLSEVCLGQASSGCSWREGGSKDLNEGVAAASGLTQQAGQSADGEILAMTWDLTHRGSNRAIGVERCRASLKPLRKTSQECDVLGVGRSTGSGRVCPHHCRAGGQTASRSTRQVWLPLNQAPPVTRKVIGGAGATGWFPWGPGGGGGKTAGCDHPPPSALRCDHPQALLTLVVALLLAVSQGRCHRRRNNMGCPLARPLTRELGGVTSADVLISWVLVRARYGDFRS